MAIPGTNNQCNIHRKVSDGMKEATKIMVLNMVVLINMKKTMVINL